MKKVIFITLAIGLLSQIGFAQGFDKTKLDNYFDALEANNKFMGSVAVSQNGKIIYTKSGRLKPICGCLRLVANPLFFHKIIFEPEKLCVLLPDENRNVKAMSQWITKEK